MYNLILNAIPLITHSSYSMSTLIFNSKNTSEIQSPTKESSLGGNMVYGSHGAIYKDVSIVRELNKAKFPVYVVQSNVTKRDFVMKVFPFKNGQQHLYFKNESRFASLQHPNVIKSLFFEQQRQAEFDGVTNQVSYIITEHASKGDFMNFLRLHNKSFDEKLTRTYFRQLINGLEYLHNNNVAHMDLKLDNLLLADDCSLKIADFDMAHYVDDAIIISNGTKLCRGPEVASGKCNDTKTADIFSAGVILFLLKTQGVFPQFENNSISGVNLAELLYNNVPEFWKTHCNVQKRSPSFFDKDFQELFIAMTKANPSDRASIKMIKESKWYNGPVYSANELKEKVGRIFTD